MLGADRHQPVAANPASDRARLRAEGVQGRTSQERTTMNTDKWRGYAAYWRQLAVAVFTGEARARTAHPPDLYRSSAQHGPTLR